MHETAFATELYHIAITSSSRHYCVTLFRQFQLNKFHTDFACYTSHGGTTTA